jgi:ABC-type antimicrobial peptide transport system permease subunit
MLRAIGFQPNMVALSFLLEASFIALSGLAIGAVAGAIVGQNMVGLFFEALAGGRTFVTPWGQIGLLVALAYGFALLTTFIPAYQASRIYPAEALRYE